MHKHFRLVNYLSLAAILVIGFAVFLMFSYDRNIQAFVAFGVAVSYVLWGVSQHIAHKDLHILIVLGYLTISSLGLLIVLSLLGVS